MSFSTRAPQFCARSGHSANHSHRENLEVEGSLLLAELGRYTNKMDSLAVSEAFMTLYAAATPVRIGDLAESIDEDAATLRELLLLSKWFVISGDLVSLAIDADGGCC